METDSKSMGSQSTTKKELRSFGLIMAGMIALFFGLIIPWLWGFGLPLWPWIVSLVFFVSAFAMPGLLRPVFVLWTKIGHVLGWFNTRLLLGIVFYLVIAPIGIVLKLMGKDPLHRKYDKSGQSYRVASKQPGVDKLEKPF